MSLEPHSFEPLLSLTEWIPSTDIHQLALSQGWHQWLLDEGSLTQRLIQYSHGDFKVDILREHQAAPHYSETQKLNISSDQITQVREVALCCAGKAVIYARSILPLEVIKDAKSEIAKLGNQPLGHFLFKQGNQRIKRRDVALVNLNGKLIPARRTPYRYKQHQILVAEFFLADLVNTI